jgi:hypothetical protein
MAKGASRSSSVSIGISGVFAGKYRRTGIGARRVREAARGNPPAATPAGRPGSTSLVPDGGGSPSSPGRRSGSVEAEGSLTREALGRVASSPYNAGTGRHCQTGRIRQARRRGVREDQRRKAPQAGPPAPTWRIWAGLRRIPAGSGLPPGVPGRDEVARPGGHGKGLRRTRGWPLGHSWAPVPTSESVVNVGTVPVLPVRSASRSVAGRRVVR